MFVNTLKSNQPFVIVIIIFLGMALWMVSFIDPIAVHIPSDNLYSPFYNLINEFVNYNSLGSSIIAFLLVLLQAFILVQFNKKYILINYRTYLPAFFYLLLASSYVQLQRLNPVLIGTLFVFASVNSLFSSYRTDYALNKIYLAGFFIAIASLFWTPFIAFVLLVWIALLILRPFIGREWLVGLLGFLTPYLFIFVYYFVFTREGQLNNVYESFFNAFNVKTGLGALHFSYYIFYGLLALTILMASYTILANFQKKKIKNRKYFEIYWWFFILCMALIIILKNVSYEIVYLVSVPIAFLLTDYFYTIKKVWFLNVILFLFYCSLIYIQITAHY